MLGDRLKIEAGFYRGVWCGIMDNTGGKGMRVVIDAATPVVKKFGEQVLNKGINMASDKVVAKIPGVTKKSCQRCKDSR